MKQHTKIALGLLAGAASGIAANLLFPGAAWVLWIAENLAVPIRQLFLRLLLMTVVPLVFASLTVAAGGVGELGGPGQQAA